MEILCMLCKSIDFSSASLHKEEPDDFPISDLDRPTDYLVYQHHSSIDALRAAAVEGCHLCCQIRKELLHIRGHERDDEYHKGPVEIRYYPKINAESKILPPTELIVVAKTPIRNVKLSFDLVQYSGQLWLY
jgi:hypothetical protein